MLHILCLNDIYIYIIEIGQRDKKYLMYPLESAFWWLFKRIYCFGQVPFIKADKMLNEKHFVH